MKNARKQVPTRSAPPPEYKLIKLPMQFRDIYNRLYRYDVPEAHHHCPVPSTGLDGTSDDKVHLLGAYILGQRW